MRVLVFGKTGQVARELARVRWPEHCSRVHLGRDDCDFADPSAAGDAVVSRQPEIVVNAAAYTAVDRAETEPAQAERINSAAPEAIAKACEQIGALFLHLSTDYVFDGSKPGAYREEDAIGPLSVYGRTKADGETAVRKNIERHVIIRTSWVFAAHGSNFVRTMLRLSAERPELRIVSDQRGAPTGARDIAGAIVSIVEAIASGRGVWGTFHYSSAEPTTWLGFAQAILEAVGRPTQIVPITTAEYGSAARRPLNSVLDCTRIAESYGIFRPRWWPSLMDVLSELRKLPEVACPR